MTVITNSIGVFFCVAGSSQLFTPKNCFVNPLFFDWKNSIEILHPSIYFVGNIGFSGKILPKPRPIRALSVTPWNFPGVRGGSVKGLVFVYIAGSLGCSDAAKFFR